MRNSGDNSWLGVNSEFIPFHFKYLCGSLIFRIVVIYLVHNISPGSSFVSTIIIVLILVFYSSIGWAFHRDRNFVRKITTWTPSKWYYLLFVPITGFSIHLLYVFKRWLGFWTS